MIEFTSKGDWSGTRRWLERMKNQDFLAGLERFGARGVALFASATPTESGETANSWTYDVVKRPGYFSIIWRNTHVENGFPVAIGIQYGHGTGTGGYVSGRDFINPVIQPLFDEMLAEFDREVRSVG